jgi:protocatechuate 3,4-dioxygenase alpha subunit
VLGRIESAARRQTLIAERNVAGSLPVYRFDIHLQGASETVFFDI